MIFGSGKFTYELVEDWARLPAGWTFLDVVDIAIDPQDRVYVFNRGSHPIIVFDPQGNFLISWGDGLFKHPHGLFIDASGAIYCTDDKLHVVYKFSPSGKLLWTIGNKERPSETGYTPDSFNYYWTLTTIKKEGPPFNAPTGVSLSSSGNIYVSDGHGNARVHKFSPDGKLLLSWGEPGGAPGQFRVPHSVWVDREDRVWVVDRENSRIQIFDENGQFIEQWIDLLRPCDIFIDNDGIVYVAELCERISLFTTQGKLLTRFGNDKGKDLEKALFLSCHCVAVDARGNLYVGEVSYADYKVDRKAKALRKFIKIS